MKVFKIVIGIILFWAILLLGGGIVSLLMLLLDKIVPGYFGTYLNPLLCNLVAAVFAVVALEKLTDGNDTVTKINYLLALVVTVILAVFQALAGLHGLASWLKFIGYLLVVIYFGVTCGKMMTNKKSPDAGTPGDKGEDEKGPV